MIATFLIAVIVIVILALAGLASAAALLESHRMPMNDAARADAPGKFVKLSRGITHYRYFGNEKSKRPLVVCVHGLTSPSFVFEAMAGRLVKKGARVLVYDHYGRGYSDRPQSKQDGAFFASHLAELLEKLGESKTPIVLCGYSMGGWVVASYAARYPEKIKQLVLIAPAGMGHLLRGVFAKLQRRVPPLARWLFMLKYPRMLLAGIDSERQLKKQVDFVNERQQRELLYRGFMPSVLSSIRNIDRRGTEAEHREIAGRGIPVVAVWGAEDDVIPLSASEKLQAWNPDAVNVVVSGAGHALAYTHSAEIVKVIKLKG